jgi:hypothetical protein
VAVGGIPESMPPFSAASGHSGNAG